MCGGCIILLTLEWLLTIFRLEDTEFCRRRRVTVTPAQFCSVETCGFDADEDPVFGWQGWLGVGVVDGEARGGRVSAGGGEDRGGHGAGGFVGPGRHDESGDCLGKGRRGLLVRSILLDGWARTLGLR